MDGKLVCDNVSIHVEWIRGEGNLVAVELNDIESLSLENFINDIDADDIVRMRGLDSLIESQDASKVLDHLSEEDIRDYLKEVYENE